MTRDNMKCPSCGRYWQTTKQRIDNYGKKEVCHLCACGYQTKWQRIELKAKEKADLPYKNPRYTPYNIDEYAGDLDQWDNLKGFSAVDMQWAEMQRSGGLFIPNASSPSPTASVNVDKIPTSIMRAVHIARSGASLVDRWKGIMDSLNGI